MKRYALEIETRRSTLDGPTTYARNIALVGATTRKLEEVGVSVEANRFLGVWLDDNDVEDPPGYIVRDFFATGSGIALVLDADPSALRPLARLLQRAARHAVNEDPGLHLVVGRVHAHERRELFKI